MKYSCAVPDRIGFVDRYTLIRPLTSFQVHQQPDDLEKQDPYTYMQLSPTPTYGRLFVHLSATLIGSALSRLS